MAFNTGDVIDGKYVVQGLCSDAGGMGTLLHVQPVAGATPPARVLKFCKLDGEEQRSRFRREVRVMQQFAGNSLVMPVLDANLDHDPPYFVMPFLSNGDMASRAHEIRGNYELLEQVFNRMIDCVEQLHAQHVIHRDIKPQNFLLTNDSLLVSDLGLCSEQDSSTAFTRSSVWWGTPGYLPPEFLAGGFKTAEPSADVFMLGKTFYFILSGRDPMYMVADGIPPQLFPVLERCCVANKGGRYQTLAGLRQSLTAAFDVLLGRMIGSGRAEATLRAIMDRLKATQQYVPQDVMRFVEELAMLDQDDRARICMELPKELFGILPQEPVRSHLGQFISTYREMAEQATYGWSFAEVIADNMRTLFQSDIAAREKAEALTAAIVAAERQNRFAAMDTCKDMITSVTDEELGQRVHEVMLQHPYYFIVKIEESACKAPAVRAAVVVLKAKEAAEQAASNADEKRPLF